LTTSFDQLFNGIMLVFDSDNNYIFERIENTSA
jgi:hypothetical protein